MSGWLRQASTGGGAGSNGVRARWPACALAVAVFALGALPGAAKPARADQGYPYDKMQVVETAHAYGDFVKRLAQAVKEEPDLNVVSRASATMGAKTLGLTIPGNAVIMVYGPKYAVRMLEASVPAGIEAPLVFYVTEDASGKVTLTYRQPSSVFAPYASAELDAMALELDAAFAAIARRAIAP
ncbi:MAG: DUF302 domain-containing protein [Gammaproteobacteria bacterium]